MPPHPTTMNLVLASASPRRRELLERAGFTFEVVASPADEIHDPAMEPAALCGHNASLKALAVAALRPDAAVIGADTLVFLDGEPLGKPADLAAAREMLARLSGRTHQVCTGVCVVFPGGLTTTFHELTGVRFRALEPSVIEDYLARVNPLDKAGSYGIQEHGDMIIEGIDGAFDNVMGLPVAALAAVLARGTRTAAGQGG